MRLIPELFTVLTIPLLAQVSPVPSSESKDVVPAFDASGEITLPAARFKIDVTYPHGKKERIETTVIYDPKTGHYLWHEACPNPSVDDTGVYINGVKAHGALAYADPAGLVNFIFPMGLYGKVWQGQADSLDAAVTASLSLIQQHLAAYGEPFWNLGYRYVPAFGGDAQLPSAFEFMCPPVDQWCPPGTTVIVSISKQGSNFRLLLRNHFDVEVIVDQNLDLVSARQLTQPK